MAFGNVNGHLVAAIDRKGRLVLANPIWALGFVNNYEKETMELVNVTYARSNVYFGDLYGWMADTGTFKIVCGQGCASCSDTMANVLPLEAFHLANHIDRVFEA